MFRVDIYGKDLQWQAPLGNYKSIQGLCRWNAISEATITVPSSHHRRELLAEPGARVRVRFRGETLMTGPARQTAGSGPGVTGDAVFSVQSDFRLLHNILGWPAPSRPITEQGAEGKEYGIGTFPAETVLKDAIRKNGLERLGIPMVIAPDQGRGANVNLTFRMHPLYDRLFPAVEAAGIGVTVEMIDGAFHVDCVEPATYPNVLTEQSRVIRKWDHSSAAPTATRGVVGAQGQGELREFIPFLDAAREGKWGDVLEAFLDARDTSDSATHAMRAQVALDDTAATGSLTVELAEAGNFKVFGPKGVRPGTRVTGRVGGGIEVTNVLSEVGFSHSRDAGLQLTSTIGPKDDPDELVMKAITALAKGLRDLRVGI